MTKTVRMICVCGLCSLILAACNSVVRLGPVGGPGGNDFEDGKQGPTIASNTRLSGIYIQPSRCLVLDPPARVIRYIQNEYTDSAGQRFSGEKHGSNETTCFYVPGLPGPIEQDEFVTGIYGRAGQLSTASAS
jgi:jacalin-like lectin domain-containing protein